MDSSKNKLTEKQLREGIFDRILKHILNKNIDKVEKALKDNPRLKKASRNADKALKNLDKELKKQGIGGKIKVGSPADHPFLD
tara:strand:+ start:664 stop:912 length:249 start_codon:yes stop_codon:yes gene_type:complete